MSIVLQSSGGGSVTVQEPATASNFTQTLPAASGTTVLTDVAGTIALNATGANIVTASTNGVERMRINSVGSVGVGTNNPLAKFVISNGTEGIEFGYSAGISGNYFESISRPAGAYVDFNYLAVQHKFFGSGAERMRIDSSGNLLVGTTSNTGSNHRQYIVGSNNVLGINATAGGTAENIRFYNAGTAVGTIQTTATATIYNTSSDYRLKENIAPMTGALATVSQLKPVTYNWKVNGSIGQGFIAHELQAVVPDCVTGEKDATRIEQYEITPAIPAAYDEEGNELTPAVEAVMDEREVPVYQGIDTSFLVATLTAAIQELNADLASTKLMLTEVSNKLDAQALEIAALKGAN